MFGPSGEWFVVGISVPIGWSELVFRRMMIDQENWWSELCQWGEVFLGEYSPGFNAVCFFALLPPVVSAGVGRSSTGTTSGAHWPPYLSLVANHLARVATYWTVTPPNLLSLEPVCSTPSKQTENASVYLQTWRALRTWSRAGTCAA